jgi:hypothetical protein
VFGLALKVGVAAPPTPLAPAKLSALAAVPFAAAVRLVVAVAAAVTAVVRLPCIVED